ncbi:MAG: DUF3137 domain-containing protein [Pseudomonadota bacterium]
MSGDWTKINQQLGFNAEAFAKAKILPLLSDLRGQSERPDYVSLMQRPMVVGMGIFFVLLIVGQAFLPDNFVGEAIFFVLFPLLFFASLGLSLWFHQDRFFSLLAAAEGNFLSRVEAMHTIAEMLDITYIPTPGGAPDLLRTFSKLPIIRGRLNRITALLDEHGGLDETIEITRASGVSTPNVILLGSEEQRQNAVAQQARGQMFQDGFEGERAGIKFSAVEWSESVSEDERVHHLVLVLRAPLKLNGRTELRTEKLGWPETGTRFAFNDVNLGPRDFSERYDLRSTDQTEARALFNPAVMARLIDLAHGDPFRAAAFDHHIVIGLQGHNRFEIVDMATGKWSDDTIRQTFADLADLLRLVEAFAHAFMVRADRDNDPQR